MSYYSRGYRRYRDWGEYHISKRLNLTNLFGGIVHDVEYVFFNLPSYELEALFIDYGHKYDKSAESYARSTYPLWKSGKTILSGQTAERLLELIPPRLSKNQRFELIRKLRQHCLKRVNEFVRTPIESWRQNVIPAVEKVIKARRDFKLPDELYEKATWLADGDVEAAHRILHSIDEEEAQQCTAYLDAEFKRIEVFMAKVKNTDTVEQKISIPQGDIYVTIEKEKPTLLQFLFGNGRTAMSENSHELVRREDLQKALAIQQTRGNLLNLTLDELTENQKIELRKKIVEEKLRLDVSQAEANQRFYNSTLDMEGTVQKARELDQLKSDYEVKSTFETASGNTNITVKKNNNTVIIVVAIVIGIIIFLLLTHSGK
jgi:hypothetical protein